MIALKKYPGWRDDLETFSNLDLFLAKFLHSLDFITVAVKKNYLIT
ncbi:MAG: hypothetical protein ACRENO_01440 [Thermodesulfobacteriota bacterium]